MKHLIVLIIILFVACQPTHSGKLTIATAANMQFTMKAISEAFTAQTGIPCETIISSSGKLTAQIIEGAPFDVFVSADMKYPTTLHEKGLTSEAPKIYAYGKMVLWSMDGEVEPSVELLKKPTVKHIALANPKTAPYGSAAIEVLKHYGMFEVVKDKLVYGESIAQTNQFITSGAAEVGFTAKAVVLSPQIKGMGKWVELSPGIYTPIAQGIALLRKEENDHARQFYRFMFSEACGSLLKKYGYELEPSQESSN